MAQEQPDDSNDLFGYDPGARPPTPRPHLHAIQSSLEDSSSPSSGTSSGLSAVADRAQRIGQLGGVLRDAFSRSYLRARQVVGEYPVRTIATIGGICFGFGAVLGLRLGHRR